jgi:hypothetical protein
MVRSISLAESGALALEHAASVLDHAVDGPGFLRALAHNRRVWSALRDIAERQNWLVPNRRQTAFALGATAKPGVNDDEIHALVAINRRVSQALAGDDIDRVRQRAYAIWEDLGRPHGQALDHWLLAEMEVKDGGQPSAAA